MLDFETWIIFISASLALAFTPGPGMLYVLSRTISGGKAVGVASTFGAASGGLIHVFGASIGISAILATSAIAFTIIKYLGAVFLIYLGLKMIFSAFKKVDMKCPISKGESEEEIKSAFNQGIISEVLNPKTAIFFLAFIPQFIRPADGYIFAQFIALGMIVVVLNAIPDFLIAFFSEPIEKLWISSSKFRKGQKVISGICLIGLGAYLAMSGSNKEIHATST
ncbi:LysE family translocator [Marinomonas transparens]|uniref:LysE family translocator n=1 Tax=Marinomonas transparens TaxID=2795388 RepID=A0A934JQI6_9GAMM|nr:LysE family translocator [Marinomonas transparens]MBJ7536552.1 LysE family translocator [Marinomonas transparens]